MYLSIMEKMLKERVAEETGKEAFIYMFPNEGKDHW